MENRKVGFVLRVAGLHRSTAREAHVHSIEDLLRSVEDAADQVQTQALDCGHVVADTVWTAKIYSKKSINKL